jgi:hypothetical protein
LLNTLADYLSGGSHNYWEYGGLAFVAIFALTYLKFWWRLPSRTRLLFAIAGVGYVSGAVGVEHLSKDMDGDTLAYNLMTVWEEGFEMYFIVLYIHAILDYMRMPAGAPRAVEVDVVPTPSR